MNGGSDIGRGDEVDMGALDEGGEQGVCRLLVLVQVGDVVLEGKDGTKVWVTTMAEADDFTVDAILLVCECECGEHNPGEVRQGKGGCIGV